MPTSPAEPRGDRRASGTRRQRWHVETTQGPGARARCSCPARAARRAEDPRLPRARDLRGPDVPLRPLGPRRRTSRASAWRASAPARRRSSTCPQIAPDVERLYVLQRTPPWVMPHSARPITRLERRLFRALPGRPARAARRHLRRARAAGARLRQAAEGHEAARAGRAASTCERALRDPELIAKATPDYTVGCKRILPSNDWYPALARENVELVTDGVAEVRPHSIVLTDGRELEVDALVFGTGFQVIDMPVGQAGPRPRRPHAGRGLGRLPARPPRLDRPRLPELLHPAGPEHRARAQLDGLHDRVPDRLRAGRAARDAGRGADSSRSGRRSRRATTPRSSGACRARSGTRAARAGTRTRRATTRRSGPTGPGASGAGRRASTHGVRGRMKRIIITGAAAGSAARPSRELRAQGARSSASTWHGADIECDVRDQASVDARGGRGDRAPRRPRRADQQRRPRHAAERGGPAPDEDALAVLDVNLVGPGA